MGGLNHVLNLVLFSHTTIGNDRFGSLLFTIGLRSCFNFLQREDNISFFLKFHLVCITRQAHFYIYQCVFFTAKINYYKSDLSFQSYLAQLSEFFLSHVTSHMILQNVV